MNAALLMAKAASLFRALGKTSPEPGYLLSRINAEICETAARGMFVTMVAGVYSPKTGELIIANAGHEPPLIHRGGEVYESLEADSPPLGIVPPFDGEPFPETALNIDNSNLYIFSDGVTEGYRPNGEPLEVEGLKELLDQSLGDPMQSRLESISSYLQDVSTPLRDDLTVLAVEGRKLV